MLSAKPVITLKNSLKLLVMNLNSKSFNDSSDHFSTVYLIYHFHRFLRVEGRGIAHHVLQSKHTIESLYAIACCDILLLPLGEYASGLELAGMWFLV